MDKPKNNIDAQYMDITGLMDSDFDNEYINNIE